jgi:predicted nucleic acid-binding protein
MTVFADTSFYIAIVNPTDVAHAKAVGISRSFQGRVLTSEFVLLEVGNYLARAEDKPVFVGPLSRLRTSASTTIIPADPMLFGRAAKLYSERVDKDWSLTDCASIVLMQDHGLQEVLSSDHHFEQAGFKALLR